MMGSSPLARGTRTLRGWKLWRRGLIPARAGNTRRYRTRDSSEGAHPRSRGEHGVFFCPSHHDMGSSPLARGTRDATVYSVSTHGLIPARAGNTSLGKCATTFMRAHPRSRGEHKVLGASPLAVEGSSPLARGTLTVQVIDGAGAGLIPARAGNTPAARRRGDN